MKSNRCGESAQMMRKEYVRDKTGKVIATILHYVCKSQHVFQREEIQVRYEIHLTAVYIAS